MTSTFLKYGKVDLIRDYWYSRHIDHPRIELLLYGMQNVSDGISLCDLANLEYGIRILQKVFSVPGTDHNRRLIPGFVSRVPDLTGRWPCILARVLYL